MDFILPAAGDIKIIIYYSICELIEILVNKKLPGGKNLIYFDGSIYDSNIHFYQIITGKYNQIRKMVLIK